MTEENSGGAANDDRKLAEHDDMPPNLGETLKPADNEATTFLAMIDHGDNYNLCVGGDNHKIFQMLFAFMTQHVALDSLDEFMARLVKWKREQIAEQTAGLILPPGVRRQ